MFDCSGTSGDYDANIAIFCNSTGQNSVALAKDSYALILKYINFLGYAENHLYFGLDVLPNSVLDHIDTLWQIKDSSHMTQRSPGEVAAVRLKGLSCQA